MKKHLRYWLVDNFLFCIYYSFIFYSSFLHKGLTETTLANSEKLFNPFFPNAPFLYLLKASKNLTVLRYFQRVEEGCIGNEWVNSMSWFITLVKWESTISFNYFNIIPPVPVAFMGFNNLIILLISLVLSLENVKLSLILASFLISIILR